MWGEGIVSVDVEMMWLEWKTLEWRMVMVMAMAKETGN